MFRKGHTVCLAAGRITEVSLLLTRLAAVMDLWQVCSRPDSTAALRLFCFPYAGGGASVFRRWGAALPGVEVRAIQLPGREARLREPPLHRLEPLLEILLDVLRPALDRPFAFFGHSMGAVIGYELARQLRREGGPMPRRLFVSGREAPHTPSERAYHTLPDPELRQALATLGGTPREVLEHDELMELLLPLLRADFSIIENYRYEPGQPLDCPITALGGTEDRGTPLPAVEGWVMHTCGGFEMHTLPGNHFFLHSGEEQVLQIVRAGLRLPGGRATAATRPPHPQPLSPKGRGEEEARPLPPKGRGDEEICWHDAAAAPPLSDDAVHVWRAALERSDADLAVCEETLSADEKARAGRFCFERDRRHYTAGRGTLRRLLGRYLGCDPASLTFRYNRYGKPALASPHGELRFNLSHSHGLALFAFTRGRDLGVDVEQVRGEVAVEQLAERFFSPQEVAALRDLSLGARRDAFFRIWTRKEAYLKATGKGLSLPLDCFDVSLTLGAAALLATRNDPAEVSRWSMRDLSVGEGFAAAVLVEGNGWRLWCGQWPGAATA
jgi:medium-chain acyl-[acyl-carrier-protein] hydrolase